MGRDLEEAKEELIKTIPNRLNSLTSLPATDLNFVSCLKGATDLQIEMALEVMRNRDGKDKGRIKACERELKRMDKQ